MTSYIQKLTRPTSTTEPATNPKPDDGRSSSTANTKRKTAAAALAGISPNPIAPPPAKRPSLLVEPDTSPHTLRDVLGTGERESDGEYDLVEPFSDATRKKAKRLTKKRDSLKASFKVSVATFPASERMTRQAVQQSPRCDLRQADGSGFAFFAEFNNIPISRPDPTPEQVFGEKAQDIANWRPVGTRCYSFTIAQDARLAYKSGKTLLRNWGDRHDLRHLYTS